MKGAAGKSIDVEFRLNRMAVTDATASANKQIAEIARTAHRYAMENSPYKTGHNRSTIKFDKDANGHYIYTMSGYGLFLETRRRNANSGAWTGKSPYIEPAIVRAVEEAKNRG